MLLELKYLRLRVLLGGNGRRIDGERLERLRTFKRSCKRLQECFSIGDAFARTHVGIECVFRESESSIFCSREKFGVLQIHSDSTKAILLALFAGSMTST